MEPRYVHGYHRSVLVSHQWRTVANSAQYLVPYLRGDSRLLDIGCGPGSLTADLATYCANGSVLGIDVSDDVIALAKTTYQEVLPHFAFQRGDVMKLNFENDFFDIVHAHQVLQHVPDPVGALVEMSRVTKPDGVVAVRDIDFGMVHWTPVSEQLDRWLATYRTMARDCGGEPDAGRHLASWVERAGLRIEVSQDSPWVFETPDQLQWWSEMWADRVLESSYAADATRLGLLSTSELEELSQGWLDWWRQPGARFVAPNNEIVARLC